VNPFLARRLATEGADVVCVSATQRETTRVLLDLIAERLRDRWAETARERALSSVEEVSLPPA
jgi:NAD(P)-dependent dehydrogenase (short-subunit alcohol dehydrogenase family)